MPYAQEMSGVYLIRNNVSGNGYVGQSVRMRKRIADHFNLLRSGSHPNPHLQNAFSKYGEASFSHSFEVFCTSQEDRNVVEMAYLSGEVVFDATPIYYNICKTPGAPMRRRVHTEETKKKIRESKLGHTEHVTPEYRRRLSEANRKRNLGNPSFVAKIKYIVENRDMSYAERGRILGIDTSSVRKLAIKYNHLRGAL
jgi:group I intron endonuclease